MNEKYRASIIKSIISLEKEKFVLGEKSEFKIGDNVILNSSKRNFNGSWQYLPNHHENFAYFPKATVKNVSINTDYLERRLENSSDKFLLLSNSEVLFKDIYYDYILEFEDSNLQCNYGIPQFFLLPVNKETEEIYKLNLELLICKEIEKETKLKKDEINKRVESLLSKNTMKYFC